LLKLSEISIKNDANGGRKNSIFYSMLYMLQYAWINTDLQWRSVLIRLPANYRMSLIGASLGLNLICRHFF